jgi:serine/threonine protein kinase
VAWPAPSDYQEAIQSPRLCFRDQELQQCEPEVDGIGLPRAISGNFAIVFPMVKGGKRWAVRCFSTYYPDQEQRYAAISEYLRQNPLSCMVAFEFLREGIHVKGSWYPVLKMEWVEGETLNRYLERNLRDTQLLSRIAQQFLDLACSLRQHTIAHGDLQHANILVADDTLRLIDYDGMYVPELEGMGSHELGHRNYQHPQRTAKDFGPTVDLFSTWSIYLSMVALSIAPDLWDRFGSGDEHLLFRYEDYTNPLSSPVLFALRQSGDPTARSISTIVESLSRLPIDQLPEVDLFQPLTVQFPTLPPPGVPDWLAGHVPSPLNVPGVSTGSTDVMGSVPAWLLTHLEPPTPITIYCNPWLDRSLAIVCLSALAVFIALSLRGAFTALASLALPSGTLVLLLAILAVRYQRIPEARTKWKLLGQWRKFNSETKRIDSTITRLSKDRRRQEVDETSEMSRTLKAFQAHYRHDSLARTLLRPGSVYGIGSELTGRLWAIGVRTAADVEYQRVKSVRGIGDARASSLVAWRRSCESSVLARMPQALPPSEAAAIRRKYQERVQAIDKQKSERQAELVKQTQAAAMAKTELEPYRRVTFGHYLKRIVVR